MRKPKEPRLTASVRITATNRAYIESRHYNLTEAIHMLVQGGIYESLLQQIESLTKELEAIQN